MAVAALLIPVLACAGADAPVARSGVLDLTGWDFGERGRVDLDGAWAFFPDRLVDPGEAAPGPPDFTPLPAYWDEALGSPDHPRRYGTATYRLRVALPPDPPRLALKLLDMGTAYALWVNGTRVAGDGVVGTDATSTRGGYHPRVVVLPPAGGGDLDVLLHVANFGYRTGGPWASIELGSVRDVIRHRELTLAMELFVAGAIAIMGLYHLVLFGLRRRDPSSLWFGLFAGCIVLRTLTTGERFLVELVPSLPWPALVRAEYLSFLVGVVVFGAFVAHLYQRALVRRLLQAHYVAGAVFIAVVLLTPVAFFSRLLPVFQLYLVWAIGYGLWALYVAVRFRLDGAAIFLLGFLGIAAGVVHDLARSIWVLDTPSNLVGAGLFLFIFAQSSLLGRRAARAFAEEERLADELADYAETLEDRVRERTSELELANRRLESLATRDDLTGIANRRHFDDLFVRHLESHRRRGAALSVVLFDIDFFKQYNDLYGHLRGDQALVAVAGAVDETLQRASDTVARYGGEEFAVVLADTDLEGAELVAARIRRTVMDLGLRHEGSGTSDRLTVSLGVATGVPDGERSELMARADRALYRAKAAGRNRWVSDEPGGQAGPGSR